MRLEKPRGEHSESERHRRPTQGSQRAFERFQQVGDLDRLGTSIPKLDGPLDAGDTAAEVARRCAQGALRKRQSARPGGRQNRHCVYPTGLSKIGHHHREGAPGKRKPRVVVHTAPPELKVVTQH